MRLELPIEQLVRRRGTRFQIGFAREARRLLPEREEFALLPSAEGLQVLARDEDALRTPMTVLRETYGAGIDIGAPQVRLIKRPRLQQPIMQVRVCVGTGDLQAVKGALERRRAVLCEEHARGNYGVVRYEAPLADLLGLPDELERLTRGTAKRWIALSHYAPLGRGPGGDAA